MRRSYICSQSSGLNCSLPLFKVYCRLQQKSLFQLSGSFISHSCTLRFMQLTSRCYLFHLRNKLVSWLEFWTVIILRVVRSKTKCNQLCTGHKHSTKRNVTPPWTGIKPNATEFTEAWDFHKHFSGTVWRQWVQVNEVTKTRECIANIWFLGTRFGRRSQEYHDENIRGNCKDYLITLELRHHI